MPLKLIIAEPRADKGDLWREEFADVPTVEVVEAPPSELQSIAEVDAELLPSLVACMRYGVAASDASEVLDTGDEPDAPSWVVTTPNIPVQESYEVGDDGKLVRVRTRTIGDEQLVYGLFRQVFSAISRLNATGGTKIDTLGFGAESVCYRCDLASHTAAIKRAYLEYLSEGSCQV